MELLNDRVIESNEFKNLQLILKNIYIKNSNNQISYVELKDAIVLFVEKIMSSYLEDTEFCKDKFSCIIKKLPSNLGGVFTSGDENAIIKINQEIISKIYFGDISWMTIIFHELIHFKICYDIELGKINPNIIRCIKEQLLCGVELEYGLKELKSHYYEDNYKVFSDEKIAELGAIGIFLSFVEMMDIQLSDECLQELKSRTLQNAREYNNYLRDLRLVLPFNDNFLCFEKAFDKSIESNPKWLEFPQLNIEYYLDENEKVRKRTKEELKERLKTETDEDITKYIQYLLTHVSSKRLEKSDFPLDNKKIEDYEEKCDFDIKNRDKLGTKK